MSNLKLIICIFLTICLCLIFFKIFGHVGGYIGSILLLWFICSPGIDDSNFCRKDHEYCKLVYKINDKDTSSQEIAFYQISFTAILALIILLTNKLLVITFGIPGIF